MSLIRAPRNTMREDGLGKSSTTIDVDLDQIPRRGVTKGAYDRKGGRGTSRTHEEFRPLDPENPEEDLVPYLPGDTLNPGLAPIRLDYDAQLRARARNGVFNERGEIDEDVVASLVNGGKYSQDQIRNLDLTDVEVQSWILEELGLLDRKQSEPDLADGESPIESSESGEPLTMDEYRKFLRQGRVAAQASLVQMEQEKPVNDR